MKVLIVLALTLIGTKVSMAAAPPDLFCTTGEAYIVFALDGSRSVRAQNFTLQKQFAADVSAAFKVGPDNTQIGALIYSSDTDNYIFHPDKYSTNRDISRALLASTPNMHASFPSDATLGLQAARYMMLNYKENATRVVIIFTAGQSSQPVKTKKETIRLKKMNAKILAIAVGNAAQSEVLDIASQPDYAFKVDSFKVIQTLKDDVIKKICQATGGHSPPDLVCTTGEAYIIFALDGSRNVTAPNFTLQKQFAADVSAAFKIKRDYTGSGANISSSRSSDYPFYPGNYSTNRDISRALLANTSRQSLSVASKARKGLSLARHLLRKGRPTAARVVIIIVDGQSPLSVKTKKETIRLKDMNAKIFAIAVGNAAQSEALDIASQPDYAFKVDSYKVIQTLKDDVIKKICQATGGHTTGGHTHRVCPNGSQVDGTQCLTLSSQKMTQADAAKSCAANNGGKIFEVRTEALYNQLGDIAKAKGVKLWAGAEETAEGEWRWLSDNSSATIPKKWFARGEPNNEGGNEECLMMKPRRKLNDAKCGKRFNFVCVN